MEALTLDKNEFNIKKKQTNLKEKIREKMEI